MNIISYRGPDKADGVSSSLRRIASGNHHAWWFVDDDLVKCNKQFGHAKNEPIAKSIVDGHYRYCNEFLWPIMHDMPKYATYKLADHFSYDRFNRLFAQQIFGHCFPYFIQDYQLGLVGSLLREKDCVNKISVFWHIPWPKNVPEKFISPIRDLANALLSAHVVGFHTKEYAQNFLRFIDEYIPESYQRIKLVNEAPFALTDISPTHHPALRLIKSDSLNLKDNQTKVLVAPLGLDFDYWFELGSELKKEENNKLTLQSCLVNTAYILSVDRADYTKGVINRLKAIEYFFIDYPELKGQVTFAQVLDRTGEGISLYDQYWQDCQKQIMIVNEKFGTPDWSPILLLEGPFSPVQLATLYRHAAVMLGNSLRDGLNLTVKEFIACQTVDDPGVLIMSPYMGAWQELGAYAVPTNPVNPQDISDAVHTALQMPHIERVEKMKKLSTQLKNNSLKQWFNGFANMLEDQSKKELKEAA